MVIPLLPVVALVLWGRSLMILTRWHFVVEEHNKRYLQWTAVRAVLQIAVIVFFSGSTAQEMVLAFGLVTLATGLMGVVFSSRVARQSLWSALRPYSFPVLLFGVLCLPSFLPLQMVSDAVYNEMIVGGLGGAAGVVLYFVLRPVRRERLTWKCAD